MPLQRLQNFAIGALLMASFYGASAHHPTPALEAPVQAAKDTRYCDLHLTEHSYRAKVARWCPLVNLYFGDEWTHWALHIITCESGGENIRNRGGGTATGLFQHLPRYWDRRAVKAGWPGADIWDPEANIAVSAWLLFSGGGRSHWTCTATK